MSIYKTALTVFAASTVAACAAPAPNAPENQIQSAYTPKSGAAVEFSSQAPKTMETGRFHTVELEFTESYPGEDLFVSLTTSEGLSVFGGMDAKTFNMSTGSTHQWDVDVSAEEDGIYYLNLFVDAQGQSRVFSVKLEIGEVTSDMRNAAKSSAGNVVNGVRVLEAEETIE